LRTFPLSDIPLSQARFPDLAGKCAIVTGGERGIGQGIAALLARQGVNVVIAGVSAPEGRRAEDEFRRENLPVTFIQVDLSVVGAADQVVPVAIAQHGGIDILVNNAARNRRLSFADYDEAIHHEIFEKNMRMVMTLTTPVVRHMIETGRRGAIVNISSVGSLRAHRESAAYDATKGAVDALTRASALDLAPHGIRVNSIAPGAIVNRPVDDDSRAFRAQQGEGIPLGRVGTVTDIANAVCFLASDAGSYITGHTLVVDGGLSTQLTPPGIYI